MPDRRQILRAAGAAALGLAGAGWAGFRRMGTMEDYTAATVTMRRTLPANPTPQDLVRFSALAANSHNTQGWSFRISDKAIDILPDPARATPVVDPDNHHLYISLGCAAENLVIAAASRGQPGEIGFDPAGGGTIRFTRMTGPVAGTTLSDAIPLRQSTRGLYGGSTLSADELDLLAKAARFPGVDLLLITDRARIGQVAELIAAANTAQIDDPAFLRELESWMRFNPRHALATGDGLFSAAGDNPNLPDWLGPRVIDWAFTAAKDNAQTAAKIASSAGLAIFVGAGTDLEHWVETGRACQRFALQATAMGLKHAFLNQPVEVARYRKDLSGLIGMPGRRPDLVIRFGRGEALPYSARRPVDAILI